MLSRTKRKKLVGVFGKEPILIEKREEDLTITIGLVAIFFMVCVIAIFMAINQSESQNDNRASYLPKHLVIK